MATVKEKIEALINTANATTGASDTTLTDCLNRLVSGYGGGGGAKTYTLSICQVFDGTQIEFGSSDGFRRYGIGWSSNPIKFEVLCGTPIYLYSTRALAEVNCSPLYTFQVCDSKQDWFLTDEGGINPGDEVTLTVVAAN